MKKIFPILLLHCFVTPSFAQAPSIQWQKSLGGSSVDLANSIQQTSEGGYIVAGWSNSNNGDVTVHKGYADYWVVKISSSGNIQWQKTYGGSELDEAEFIQQTTDGGYIVIGQTRSVDGDVIGNHGGHDCWVLKLNDTGGIQWQKCLGGSSVDFGHSLQQTTDGGYIVASSIQSTDAGVTGYHGGGDYWIIKLTSSGAIQWQRSLGGSGLDWAFSIQKTTDGGYVVAGKSNSMNGDVTGNHGDYDFWVVKLNDTGAIQWQRSLGGPGEDWAFAVQQTFDGGYIVAGRIAFFGGDITDTLGGMDIWVVKLSSAGSIQWQKCLGGNNTDWASSVQQTSDSGYVVAGGSMSDNGDVIGHHDINSTDNWIVKLSPSGNVQWQKCLGGNNTDWASDIHQTVDNGFIIAGISASVDGDVTGNHGDRDFWIIKLSGITSVHTVNKPLISIFPNPTTGTISITGVNNTTIKVYNTISQLIASAHNTDHISIAEVPAGLYFVRVFNELGELLKQEKVMKQ